MILKISYTLSTILSKTGQVVNTTVTPSPPQVAEGRSTQGRARGQRLRRRQLFDYHGRCKRNTPSGRGRSRQPSFRKPNYSSESTAGAGAETGTECADRGWPALGQPQLRFKQRGQQQATGERPSGRASLLRPHSPAGPSPPVLRVFGGHPHPLSGARGEPRLARGPGRQRGRAPPVAPPILPPSRERVHPRGDGRDGPAAPEAQGLRSGPCHTDDDDGDHHLKLYRRRGGCERRSRSSGGGGGGRGHLHGKPRTTSARGECVCIARKYKRLVDSKPEREFFSGVDGRGSCRRNRK